MCSETNSNFQCSNTKHWAEWGHITAQYTVLHLKNVTEDLLC